MGETKGGGDRREEKRREYSVRMYSLVLSRPNVSIIKMIRCVGPSLVMEGGGRVLISDSLRGDCVVLCSDGEILLQFLPFIQLYHHYITLPG